MSQHVLKIWTGTWSNVSGAQSDQTQIKFSTTPVSEGVPLRLRHPHEFICLIPHEISQQLPESVKKVRFHDFFFCGYLKCCLRLSPICLHIGASELYTAEQLEAN